MMPCPAVRVTIPYRIGLSGEIASELVFEKMQIAREFELTLIEGSVLGENYRFDDFKLIQGGRALTLWETMSLEEVLPIKLSREMIHVSEFCGKWLCVMDCDRNRCDLRNSPPPGFCWRIN